MPPTKFQFIWQRFEAYEIIENTSYLCLYTVVDCAGCLLEWRQKLNIVYDVNIPLFHELSYLCIHFELYCFLFPSARCSCIKFLHSVCLHTSKIWFLLNNLSSPLANHLKCIDKVGTINSRPFLISDFTTFMFRSNPLDLLKNMKFGFCCITSSALAIFN